MGQQPRGAGGTRRSAGCARGRGARAERGHRPAVVAGDAGAGGGGARARVDGKAAGRPGAPPGLRGQRSTRGWTWGPPEPGPGVGSALGCSSTRETAFWRPMVSSSWGTWEGTGPARSGRQQGPRRRVDAAARTGSHGGLARPSRGCPRGHSASQVSKIFWVPGPVEAPGDLGRRLPSRAGGRVCESSVRGPCLGQLAQEAGRCIYEPRQHPKGRPAGCVRIPVAAEGHPPTRASSRGRGAGWGGPL